MNREQPEHGDSNPFRTPTKNTDVPISTNTQVVATSSGSDSPSQSDSLAFSNTALKRMQQACMNIY